MLIKLRKVNNLLTVRPLSDQLCQALEAQLRYTRKISLHGKEAELAHSHIRLEERNLFCYSQNRLVTPIGFLPRVSKVITKLGHTIDYANLIAHPRPQAFEPCWECVDRYMARTGMKFRIKQKELLQKLVDNERGGVDCSVGWGKAQPLSATVHTPSGPKQMGEIKIGDQVCHPAGGSSRVVAIHPQGVVPIYRVRFRNGDCVECCGDHVWVVEQLGRRNKARKSTTLTTRQLQATVTDSRGVCRYGIPTVQPLQYRKRKLSLPPYLLGVLLGDGCFSGSVSFTSMDAAIVRTVRRQLVAGYGLRRYRRRAASKAVSYYLVKTDRKKTGRGHKNYYRQQLERFGLWSQTALTKHIPANYLCSSTADRWELLRGLLDTDGTVEKTGGVRYSTSSPVLAKQVKQLVESLGGVCSICEKPTRHALNYNCGLTLPDARLAFKLARKQKRVRTRTRYLAKRVIVSVEPAGEQAAQCITVDAADGMYVTDHAIATHNSSMFRLAPLLFPKARIDIVTTAADVVRQIRNDVSDTGIYVGQLGAGKRDVQARVVVVCAKSLHRCTFDDTDIVLADEAQELATDGYLEQLAQYTKARMFMFSATVGMRMDSADVELEGCFGPTILKVPFQVAAQDKAVVPIKVQWVPVASDYNPGAGLSGTRRSRRAIWRHGFRNRIIADTARTIDADTQTLVVVDKIEHALALKEFLPEYTLVYAEAGLTPAKRAKFAKSGLVIKDEPPMTIQRRIWLKKQFETGELKKVIATGVWNRGVNFKKLAVLIRADAGGSAINDTQIPGRVCRLSEDKKFGLVIDFTDQFDRGYQQRAKRRRKNYEANGWTQHHEGLGKSLLRNQHLQ